MFDNIRATGLALRKQHLVPLTFASKSGDVLRIVGDVCGLQWDSSEVENPDWVLRNRFTEYDTDWLQDSIKDRSVTEFRLMRGCRYIVPSQELPYYFAGTREATRKSINARLGLRFANAIQEKESRVLKALGRQAPTAQRELSRQTKLNKNDLSVAITNLEHLGYIVMSGRVGKDGLWSLTDDWLPKTHLGGVTEEEGQEYLTVKFFKATGVSTKYCLGRWTGWGSESTTRNVDKLLKRGVLSELTPHSSEGMIALKRDAEEFSGYIERDSTVRLLSPFDPYLCMREPLLSLDSFSPAVAGTYSLLIGGILAAAFRLTKRTGLLFIDEKKVFQGSLLSARSAEIRREMEMHAASTGRSIKLSPKVRALL